MTITATLLGLSIGSMTPARAAFAILVGTSGFAWVEHEAERANDGRKLLAFVVAVLVAAWAIDLHADDAPMGIAGPVLEVVLGAGLVGAIVLSFAARRLLTRRSRGSSGRSRDTLERPTPSHRS
jgi:hypothetical protein